jgi:SAM-dependent methyltransferase
MNRIHRKDNNAQIDTRETTVERANIIKRKYFLHNSYKKYYSLIDSLLSPQNKSKKVIELGSGGGFIKEIIPNVITSDIQKLPGVDKSFSATKIPYRNNSVNAFAMINVLHHIDDVSLFFDEAERCLKNGGQIIMIEPALTLFGRIIYKYFHHEPFKPSSSWKFRSTGPLTGANSALPWILFYRDRKKFEKNIY